MDKDYCETEQAWTNMIGKKYVLPRGIIGVVDYFEYHNASQEDNQHLHAAIKVPQTKDFYLTCAHIVIHYRPYGDGAAMDIAQYGCNIDYLHNLTYLCPKLYDDFMNYVWKERKLPSSSYKTC